MNTLQCPERYSSSQSSLFEDFQLWRKSVGKVALPSVTLENTHEIVDHTHKYIVRDSNDKVLVKTWVSSSVTAEPGYVLEATIRAISRTGYRRDILQQTDARCIGTSAFVTTLDMINNTEALPRLTTLLRPGKHICDQLVSARILQIDQAYVGEIHGPFKGAATLAMKYR